MENSVSRHVAASGRGICAYGVASTIRREWSGRAGGAGGRPVWGIGSGVPPYATPLMASRPAMAIS